MPRLHGYAETTKAHFYDAIFDGLSDNDHGWSIFSTRALEAGSLRLFGNCNIGIQELTNLQAQGTLGFVQSVYIQNWYARTNIEPCAALDEWAHSTTVTLNVGCHQAMLLNLYDLFRRIQDVPLPASVEDENVGKQIVEDLARVMFEAHEGFSSKRRGLHDLPESERSGWLAAAAAAKRHIDGKPVIIVPVRQNVDIRIDTSPSAFSAFQAAIAKHQAEHGKIEPRPRAWVHLEGFARRDVC